LSESPFRNGDPNAGNAAANKNHSVAWALVRLAVGIALLAYLAESRIIDLRALTRLVTAWPLTLAALSLIFLDIALMAVRLCWLFQPQGLRLPLVNSLELTLVSSFFATFLPGGAGGDLAKLFYAAKQNKGRRTEIVTIVAFDRVVGLFSVLLLPLLFAPLFPGLIRSLRVLQVLLVTSAVLAACLFSGFLLCVFRRTWIDQVARWISRLLPGKKVPERAVAAIAAYRHSPGILLAALGASFATNLTFIAATAVAILVLSPGSLSLKMCLVVPMGDVANSLPLTPGGLGVGEAAFNALFKLAGLQGGAEALLCWRIWRAMAGLVGLVLYLRGVGRAVFEPEQAGP
jgi:glycosyltransferase 2 family protein